MLLMLFIDLIGLDFVLLTSIFEIIHFVVFDLLVCYIIGRGFAFVEGLWLLILNDLTMILFLMFIKSF